MTTFPRIGITLGDPAGIGPEIVASALAHTPPALRRRLTVFADRPVLERAFAAAPALLGELDVVDCATPGAAAIVPGRPDEAAAAAQVRYLETAADRARAGDLAALVTAPISKSTARRAGFAFPGHTEFLAARLGAGEVAMMFAGPSLRVVLATVHVALADVPQALTIERITSAARLGAASLRRDFALERPRIGVLGLNPHAGEGGLFGREEIDVVAPAIEALRSELGESVEIHGPLVPDAAYRQPFDLFVALYHDQGLVPVKLVDFEQSVNVTLGLPIVRTSPDHGVAYDIAGRGVARHASFGAALRLASEMLRQRAATSPASAP